MSGPKPYKFIGFGDSYGPKPYKFIGFGDIYGPKPYKFIGFGYLKAVWPEFCGRVLKAWPAQGALESFQSLQKCGGLRPPQI